MFILPVYKCTLGKPLGRHVPSPPTSLLNPATNAFQLLVISEWVEYFLIKAHLDCFLSVCHAATLIWAQLHWCGCHRVCWQCDIRDKVNSVEPYKEQAHFFYVENGGMFGFKQTLGYSGTKTCSSCLIHVYDYEMHHTW